MQSVRQRLIRKINKATQFHSALRYRAEFIELLQTDQLQTPCLTSTGAARADEHHATEQVLRHQIPIVPRAQPVSSRQGLVLRHRGQNSALPRRPACGCTNRRHPSAAEQHAGLSAGPYAPLHVTHEDSHKVKDVLQRIGTSLQDVVSETPQENEEVAQVISKEFCEQRLDVRSPGAAHSALFWPQ